MKTHESVGVAVVGCGYWGPNLIRNFRSSSNCQLRMMCDRDAKRLTHLKALYPEVQTETDFQRVLKADDIGAVAIATPVRFHHALAKQCLQAGKHTFIEKPMASSVAQCQELVELAARQGVTLMVGHTFLYSASVRKIKEIVDSGAIGKLRYISSRRLNLGLFQKDINVVWDLAPHDLSIILHIIGETPSTVNCQGRAHVTARIEDVANLTMSFPGGGFATVSSSWLDPKKVREMTFVGTTKMIVYDDLEPLHKIRIYDQRVEVPPHYDTFGEFQYSYHYGEMVAPYVKQEEPLKVECQHFIDCLRGGKTPISSGVAGMEVVRILEAANESLKQNGGCVTLSESKGG